MSKSNLVLAVVVVIAVFAYVMYHKNMMMGDDEQSITDESLDDSLDKRGFLERFKDGVGFNTWNDTLDQLPAEF